MSKQRLAASLAIGLAFSLIAGTFITNQTGLQNCPRGYHPVKGQPGQCISDKHPEPFWEVELRQREWMSARTAPHDRLAPGAFASALEERRRIKDRTRDVRGVEGTWTPYGRGPLISDNSDYPASSGLGISKVAGRIDNLAYDAENRRLFATKGTGGIWMSTDLGDTWTSIGDTLPSQIIAAVAWSKARNRLVALSGDPALGSYTYTGFGAFYSDNVGATWSKASGLPDGAPGFAIEVDPANTNIVYAATFAGLFRSTDAGATYANVGLPTGCTNTSDPLCYLANVVTDVVIKEPGGVSTTLGGITGTATGPSSVLAVVGWRSGRRPIAGTSTPQSPNNGIYRSTTGAPGTFTKLATTGFAPQDRIGRVELAAATGPLQDHNYVYAIVQDAVAVNGGLEVLDAPEGVFVTDPRPIGPTLPLLGAKLGQLGGTNLHGVYVSPNFGQTWTLMADDNTISKNPATGSALVVIGQAIGYEPGVQAWYNLFIAPDPTQQTPAGIPTRLVFGLEEVWQNEIVGQPLIGPTAFKVIGRYFSGETCMFLTLPTPECPTDRPPTYGNTTHPDQHAALWIPDSTGGGVTLAVGNDGGFYKQHVGPGAELNNGGWGEGHQNGFNTLLPYDVAMAKDGTAYAGLQDNGHMKITPAGQQFAIYGGDGTYAEVDPDNSDIAYEATPGGAMRVTTDGGATWRSMPPPVTNTRFVNPFEMDPTDANHLVTAGRQIVETIWGPNTGLVGSEWRQVFDLGTVRNPGTAATASATDPANTVSAIDVQGDAVYVAFCGPCTQNTEGLAFGRGLATNVGGSETPERLTSKGWHIASATGLPNRYIMGVAIDPFNPRRIYVALGGYSVRWIPPGALNDLNESIGSGHVFVSDDAGATFRDISGNLPDAPATSIVIRGKQLIVGTDVGVFASDVRGGTNYAVLGSGLPIVPISTMQLAPGDCNRIVAATYGRGIYTFAFASPLPGRTRCDGGGVGGDPVETFVPAERVHSGNHAWWGGSQSLAESHMTMPLTLPADATQLRFWTWYSLEDGYDWAYALISTDGGSTWTSLLTTSTDGSGTTAIDPIGTVGALGGNKDHPNGFTGSSGAQPNFSGQDVHAPVYSQQTADIAAFAGRPVLLRFAYTSDPATDLDGFYVDDVSILNGGGLVIVADDMETAGTWQPGGSPGFRRITKAP